jgi:hypothetical protein
MQDVIVGLLAVAIGAVFCFAGFIAMRIVIPLWGAFAGLVFGAGLIDVASDDGFLRSWLQWLVGLAFAGLFAALAYLYYEITIVVAMGAIGFAIGTSVMVALGISWSWVIVLVGLAAGVLLALAAIVGNLPGVLLIVLSALAGASTMVGGLMLLTGAVDTADFDHASVTERLDDDWWWYALYLALVIAGIIGQVRTASGLDRSLRDSWADQGGRQFRAP